MTWSAPPTWTNSVLTSAQLQILSDDLKETAAAKATTAGSIFVGTGLNTLAERIPVEAIRFESEPTTSTVYTNLSTIGAEVFPTTGTKALLGVTSDVNNDTVGAVSFVSFTIRNVAGNVITHLADDNYALAAKCESGPSSRSMIRASSFRLVTGLTAGQNEMQMKYRVGSASTGTFNERSILVIPL